jgi:adenosine deaminase
VAALSPPLRRFVEAMPKVELHVHLEGAMRPATLLRLARRRGVDLPADDEAGLDAWFRFEDFQHFLEIYLVCSRCLRDPEDFQLLIEEFMAEQASQNVVHSEVHFTISTHAWNGANAGEVGDAMGEAIADGERRHGISLRLIPDIVRNVGVDRADMTLEWALEHRRNGVVALGLSGIEGHSAAPFEAHFREALAEDLHRVAHAGEHQGPDSIREAISVCRPERIGHGIRAVDDPELVAELAETGLPLEVCPASNVRLGAAPSVEEHPLGELLARGVALSVNSDDPALFQTRLTDEYLSAAEVLDLDAAALAGLSRAALDHAFLDQGRRRQLEALYERRFAELGEEHLGEAVTPRRPVRPAR